MSGREFPPSPVVAPTAHAIATMHRLGPSSMLTTLASSLP